MLTVIVISLANADVNISAELGDNLMNLQNMTVFLTHSKWVSMVDVTECGAMYIARTDNTHPFLIDIKSEKGIYDTTYTWRILSENGRKIFQMKGTDPSATTWTGYVTYNGALAPSVYTDYIRNIETYRYYRKGDNTYAVHYIRYNLLGSIISEGTLGVSQKGTNDGLIGVHGWSSISGYSSLFAVDDIQIAGDSKFTSYLKNYSAGQTWQTSQGYENGYRFYARKV